MSARPFERLVRSERSSSLLIFDASAAIELVLDRPAAQLIAEDLRRGAPMVMPAHFEADGYAGLRRMVRHRDIDRDELERALPRLMNVPGERVPLAPLLPHAYALFDRVGAHDAFYVVLAQLQGAALLTADGPLAIAAEALGVTVLLRQSR